MKIQISKDESYEIKIPNEINANDFMKLMTSFDNVIKLIRFNLVKQGIKEDENFRIDENGNRVSRVHYKDKINKIDKNLNLDGTPRKSYTKSPKFLESLKNKRKTNLRDWCNTKEKVLDLMQYAYHGTKEDRKRIVKITGETNWDVITKSFFGLKNRYDIQPQEVGLTSFGNKGLKAFNFKIPNYIIKSYTGIFDENGNEENKEE